MLGVDGWVQGNGSCVVLPLTRHQCKRRWAPQITRETSKVIHKRVWRKPQFLLNIFLC